ncbi:hypothetical protein NUU61_003475 [Penicillium alfredii]|uniref:Major facilitator superfamily (MFS) profile domain-containing protein n=1 Tax=Penicillium alfredii TaxID=1506179 RepID=A0A9W9FJH0_9EURO|nr:uncharacterized protein NUU61_003475 [Penicillium alfredii]KAJ5101253.1 hypothetical protein NUU61_003475 [Penicillium alfredii]
MSSVIFRGLPIAGHPKICKMVDSDPPVTTGGVPGRANMGNPETFGQRREHQSNLELWTRALTLFLILSPAYWLDYGTSFTQSSLQWRFPLAFQAVFAIFLVLQVIGLPETPRWLMKNDRYDEAREVVAAINDASPNDEEVIQSLADIDKAVQEDVQGQGLSWREFFLPMESCRTGDGCC